MVREHPDQKPPTSNQLLFFENRVGELFTREQNKASLNNLALYSPSQGDKKARFLIRSSREETVFLKGLSSGVDRQKLATVVDSSCHLLPYEVGYDTRDDSLTLTN